jgi:hypothetical protein
MRIANLAMLAVTSERSEPAGSESKMFEPLGSSILERGVA